MILEGWTSKYLIVSDRFLICCFSELFSLKIILVRSSLNEWKGSQHKFLLLNFLLIRHRCIQLRFKIFVVSCLTAYWYSRKRRGQLEGLDGWLSYTTPFDELILFLIQSKMYLLYKMRILEIASFCISSMLLLDSTIMNQ